MRSLFAYSLISLLSALIGFVSIPISTRLFGQELLGQLNFLLSLSVMLLTVSLAGMDQGYLRFYYEKSDMKRRVLLRYCIETTLVIAAIISVVLVIFRDAVGSYIGGDPLLVTFALIQLLAALIVLRFSICYCRVTESVILFGFFTIINTVFNKCIYLFSVFDRSIHGSLVSITLIAVVTVIACTVFLVKKSGKNDANVTLDENEKKAVARYAMPLVPAMALSNVNLYIPLLSVRSMLGFGAAGLFSMSVTLASVINIIGSGVNSFWPSYVFKNYRAKQSTIQLFHRILVFALFVFACILIVLRPLVALFLGPGYEQSSVLFSILLLSPLCYTIGETAGIGIHLSKESHLFLVIYGAGIAINIALSHYLVSFFGVMGAAISVSVTAIVMLLLKAVFGNQRYDSTGSLRWLISAIILISLQLTMIVNVDEYALSVALSIACLILYPALVGLSSFTSSIKETFSYLRAAIAGRRES